MCRFQNLDAGPRTGKFFSAACLDQGDSAAQPIVSLVFFEKIVYFARLKGFGNAFFNFSFYFLVLRDVPQRQIFMPIDII